MKTWVKALLAGTLALGPTAALAAIDNTHHDMIWMGLSDQRCAFCHSKVGLTAVTGVTLGKVGAFCVQVCHIAGSAVDQPAQSIDVVPTSPGSFSYAAGVFTMANNSSLTSILTQEGNSHGLVPSALTGIGYGVERTSVNGIGWPYTNDALNQMQCTSCHAVHDATYPPFLNARLTDGGQTTNFCARCHTSPDRIADFTVAGNHPTEFEWDPLAASGRTGQKSATDPATRMNGRRIVVGTGITNINVQATVAGTFNTKGSHWNLGGHVIDPTTGLPKAGSDGANAEQFGCYSCHQVHQRNNTAGVVAKGLLVGSDLSDVCYGCHTMNPGKTNYGHPIDEDTVLNKATQWDVVPLTAAYTAINNGYKNPTAPSKGAPAPYCVTCHDVHGAATNRMAIRVIGTKAVYSNTAPVDNVCEQCHGTEGSGYTNPTTANKHHPGRTTTNYVDVNNGGFPAAIAWTTADALGDLQDGLTCGDCHVGDGTPSKRATAHNWQ